MNYVVDYGVTMVEIQEVFAMADFIWMADIWQILLNNMIYCQNIFSTFGMVDIDGRTAAKCSNGYNNISEFMAIWRSLLRKPTLYWFSRRMYYIILYEVYGEITLYI